MFAIITDAILPHASNRLATGLQNSYLNCGQMSRVCIGLFQLWIISFFLLGTLCYAQPSADLFIKITGVNVVNPRRFRMMHCPFAAAAADRAGLPNGDWTTTRIVPLTIVSARLWRRRRWMRSGLLWRMDGFRR